MSPVKPSGEISQEANPLKRPVIDNPSRSPREGRSRHCSLLLLTQALFLLQYCPSFMIKRIGLMGCGQVAQYGHIPAIRQTEGLVLHAL